MTDPQAGTQPSSGTNRPVPGMRAPGDGPGTLIPLAGRLLVPRTILGIREKQIPILQATDSLCNDPAPKYWDEEALKKGNHPGLRDLPWLPDVFETKYSTRLERI